MAVNGCPYHAYRRNVPWTTQLRSKNAVALRLGGRKFAPRARARGYKMSSLRDSPRGHIMSSLRDPQHVNPLPGNNALQSSLAYWNANAPKPSITFMHALRTRAYQMLHRFQTAKQCHPKATGVSPWLSSTIRIESRSDGI